MARTKTTTENSMKYYIRINGKRSEVTKEEFEKHFPPVTETETETATTE